jgi:hypothetical protein
MSEPTNPVDNVHSIASAAGHRTMEGIRALSGMLSRMGLNRLLSFNGKRNYQEIFGWDSTITPDMMLYMYNRGGIAKRVVDAYPDATWARPPVLWAEGDDEWTTLWAERTDDWALWQALHRLDKLAGLGHYAIFLIGTDRPGLEMPLTKAEKITFLQPFGESSVKIERYDTVQTSPNYGKPLIYRVYPEVPGSLTGRAGYGSTTQSPVRGSFRVHASRVLHVAKGCLEDEVFGQPDMAPVWDYLTDLRKVVGSSAESYWITANRGLQADIDKDMSLSPDDQAALQAEVEEFYNGFRRFIRTKGVKMNALENDLANPQAPFDVLITLIAGARGIPKRILLGSETGQLASGQDKGNWAERVEENRALHVEPRIIKPFVQKAMALGLIRPPSETAKLRILWPDAYRMNPLERGQTSAQTGRVLSYITKLLESESQEARQLMNREEMRALLGHSTDNRVLKDEPNP